MMNLMMTSHSILNWDPSIQHSIHEMAPAVRPRSDQIKQWGQAPK